MVYTLEHIKDRVAALREAGRVIGLDGEIIIIVPGFLESLFYPFSFYKEIFCKFTEYVFGGRKADMSALPDTENFSNVYNGKTFKEKLHSAYPHFPMPEPHGDYADYCSELMRTNTLEWLRLINESGLKVKEIFTTMLFPKALSSVLVGGMALDIYVKTLWINTKLGKSPILKHFGQNLCLILGK
jgi:hypothetical protein